MAELGTLDPVVRLVPVESATMTLSRPPDIEGVDDSLNLELARTMPATLERKQLGGTFTIPVALVKKHGDRLGELAARAKSTHFLHSRTNFQLKSRFDKPKHNECNLRV